MTEKKSGINNPIYAICVACALLIAAAPLAGKVVARQQAGATVDKQFDNSMLVYPHEMIRVDRTFANTNLAGGAASGSSCATGSFSNANIVIAQIVSQTPSEHIAIHSAAVAADADLMGTVTDDNGDTVIQEIKLSSLIDVGDDIDNIFGHDQKQTGGQAASTPSRLTVSSIKNIGQASFSREPDLSRSARLYLSFNGNSDEESASAENPQLAGLMNANLYSSESETALDLAEIEGQSSTLPTSNVLLGTDMKDLNIATLTNPSDQAHGKNQAASDFTRTYIVTANDTIFTIAKNYGVSVSELMSANKLQGIEIKPGAQLLVPAAPKKDAAATVAKAVPANAPDRKFLWPCTSRKITSKFGTRVHPVYHVRKFHNGMDIGAPYGSRIKAVEGGKVVYSGWKSGYGRVVIIKHSKDIYTLYAHCSQLVAKNGQFINRGDTVGKIGQSGIATGPHLHFSVQKSGRFVNPMGHF